MIIFCYILKLYCILLKALVYAGLLCGLNAITIPFYVLCKILCSKGNKPRLTHYAFILYPTWKPRGVPVRSYTKDVLEHEHAKSIAAEREAERRWDYRDWY